MKKYFSFHGTISGSTYFFRNVLVSIFTFILGLVIPFIFDIFGIAGMIIGTIIGIPIIMFSFATSFKRVMALFPKNGYTIAPIFMFTLPVIQLFTEYENDSVLVQVIVTLMMLFSIYLIFANSDYIKHNG